MSQNQSKLSVKKVNDPQILTHANEPIASSPRKRAQLKINSTQDHEINNLEIEKQNFDNIPLLDSVGVNKINPNKRKPLPIKLNLDGDKLKTVVNKQITEPTVKKLQKKPKNDILVEVKNKEVVSSQLHSVIAKPLKSLISNEELFHDFEPEKTEALNSTDLIPENLKIDIADHMQPKTVQQLNNSVESTDNSKEIALDEKQIKKTTTKKTFKLVNIFRNAIVGVALSYFERIDSDLFEPVKFLWKHKASICAGTAHLVMPILITWILADSSEEMQALFLDGGVYANAGKLFWLFLTSSFVWTLAWITFTKIVDVLIADVNRCERIGRGFFSPNSKDWDSKTTHNSHAAKKEIKS